MIIQNNPSNPDPRHRSANQSGQLEVNGQSPILESRSLPEISQLFIASRYRLRTTLICATVLAILSAAIALYFVPAQYLASATVRVLQREGFLLTTQQSRAEDASFVRAQQALVTQDQTLINALKDKELCDLIGQMQADDPVSWLKGQIKAEMSAGSETMTITASNPSAEIAVQASRAVTQAYLAAITEQLRSSRDRRINELENTALEVDERLMQQWRLLQSKSGTIGSGNPLSIAVSEQLKLQSFRENSQRLRSLLFQRSQLELQLSAEKESKPISVESHELQIKTSVGQHPEVVSLRDQIRKVDLKILEMKQLVQSDSAPQMVRLQNERSLYLESLNQTETKITALERNKRIQESSTQGPNPRIKELEGQLALTDLEIKELQATTTQLETSIVEASGPTGVELEIIRHEIEREERLADSLWKTIQELRIEARAEPRVAMGALPSTTNRLSRAKQWKAVSGAAALGLMLGILGVGFLEWGSRRIRSADEVVKNVRLQVFEAKAKGIGSEAKVLLAQLLLRGNPDGSLPSVFITSASVTEPRHRFSIELAKSIVESGRKVLLVTCDNEHGTVADAETNEASVDEKASDWFSEIHSSATRGFDYLRLKAGQMVLQRIASKSMTAFLKKAEERYDSLIVIGSAVLPNPESVLIASSLDFTVLVAELGHSRLDQLITARNRLNLPSVNILGTVLMSQGSRSPFRSSEPFRISDSDLYAAESVNEEVETEVLASVTELHGQITQFDTAQPPIANPHLSPSSRKKQPSKSHRTTE